MKNLNKTARTFLPGHYYVFNGKLYIFKRFC